MAAGVQFDHEPPCSCGSAGVGHDVTCVLRSYQQGFMDGICGVVGKHLLLEHFDGHCARCGRDESGTLPS